MQPTTMILEKINRNSAKNKDEVFTKLYRYLLRPDIYYLAYKNLYSNDGAVTKGVDDDTADHFGEEKIKRIIQSLKDESYQPKPVRRTYLKKENGKMRPIGIPTFTDKLVQEVMKMILEAIYEPLFSPFSHGFRPERSCHTAIYEIKKGFNGVKWFVEGDIKGCFDNINHAELINIINKKIKDARLIKLIYKFLKAGYSEDWKYNNTYSGTPQGGIISPLLSNIYLNELDKYVEKLQSEFEKPPESAITKEYRNINAKLVRRRKKLAIAQESEKPALLKEIKELKAQLVKTPCSSPTGKVIKYVRYADDFLIGVKGDKEDCEMIKARLKTFIAERLKMELSEEKTLITHSSDHARFLGFDIAVRRNNQVKVMRDRVTGRTLNNTIEVNIPLQDKIEKFLFNKNVVIVKDGSLYPQKRNSLLRLTDLEIVDTYNSELRGLCNYYNIASNFNTLNYFSYLMEYSCLHTLAGKHKTKISKIKGKYQKGKTWGIPYETKTEKKVMYIAKHSDCRNNKFVTDIMSNAQIVHSHSPTTFEKRLKANKCELCGKADGKYDIHHINKVKNLKGKEPWEKMMIAKRRKTMVVCEECHAEIHKQNN